MSDVICLSSDDENDIPTKSKKRENNENSKERSNHSQKRKITSNSSAKHEFKRQKYDTESVEFSDNNKSISCTSSRDVNISKSNSSIKNVSSVSKTSVNEDFLSKPGTSKEFDTEQVNISSTKIEINTSAKSRFSSPPNRSQPHPIRKVIKPQLIVKEKVPISEEPTDDIFEKYIDVCIKKKNNEDTKEIVKKLRKLYEQLNPFDKNSDEFKHILSKNLQKLLNSDTRERKEDDKKGIATVYHNILELRNEIKRHIKKPKKIDCDEKKSNHNEHSDGETIEDGIMLSKEDMKKVKKLDKKIKECQDKIKELEFREVNFDDEEDSVYLQEDRYKRKLVELCEYRSKIVGDEMLKREIYKKQLRRKDIPEELTTIVCVDEAIINFINSGIKKVNRLKHIKQPSAIADYLTVPDYPDILQCIKKCNNERALELTKKKMESLARTAFKAIGRYLKRQRMRETEEYISSLADDEIQGDPAVRNIELREKLQSNKKLGDKKLDEIFKKYVDKQEGLNPEDLDEQESNEVTATEDESENESVKHEEQKKRKYKILSDEEKNEEQENNENEENKIVKEKYKNEVEKDKKDKDKVTDQTNQESSEISKNSDEKKSKSIVVEDRKNHQNNISDENKINKTDNVLINNSNKEITDISNESNGISDINIISKPSTSKALTIISQICGINNSPKSNEISNKVDDAIEILSDSDVNMEDESSNTLNEQKDPLQSTKNDSTFKDSTIEAQEDSIDIVLELSTDDNANENEVEDPLGNIDKSSIEDNVIENVHDDLDNTLGAVTNKNNSAIENENDPLITVNKENDTDNNNSGDTLLSKETSIENSTSSKSSKSKTKDVMEVPNHDNNVSHNACTSSDKKSIENIINLTADQPIPKNKSSTKSLVNETQKNLKFTETQPQKVSSSINETTDISQVSNPKKVDQKLATKSQSEILIQSVETVEILEEIEVVDIPKDTKNKKDEKKNELEKKSEDLDEAKPEKNESSFIKVRSFAKPPKSWKDSPEKNKSSFKIPIQQTSQGTMDSDCVIINNEKNNHTSQKTKILNPLAIDNRRSQFKNVVVVKNIINNIVLPSDQIKGPKVLSDRIPPRVGKSITITPRRLPSISNDNQRSNNSVSTSIIRRRPVCSPFRNGQNIKNSTIFK